MGMSAGIGASMRPSGVCVVRILAAFFAFFAAALWFWSAASALPPPTGMRLGYAIPTHPFYGALLRSAALNRWAALFTVLSVALGAFEHLPARGKWRL